MFVCDAWLQTAVISVCTAPDNVCASRATPVVVASALGFFNASRHVANATDDISNCAARPETLSHLMPYLFAQPAALQMCQILGTEDNTGVRAEVARKPKCVVGNTT